MTFFMRQNILEAGEIPPSHSGKGEMHVRDQYGRVIDYMRVSITDRCNLRCKYCMPDGIDLVPMEDVMTYEEIVEVCSIAAELGIRKLKVTGGEPLVRLGCADLIHSLKAIPGIEQVTMTTNGVLLGQCLQELLKSGLDAVNISLDTLSRERFAAITGRDELPAVLESIEAAIASPLRVKLNVLLQKGINDEEWFSLASLAKEKPLDVRFIEMMPIGSGREFTGIANPELREELQRRFPNLEEDGSVHGNGPATYVKIPGWSGSIGFISAIHGKFCDSCNRLRLVSQGELKPCLCYGDAVGLMPVLREEQDAEKRRAKLRAALEEAVRAKPKQHCFEEPEHITETGRMARIGG